MWMCSLCRPPVAENHNFWQILTFLGLLYRPPFTDEGNIWCAKADQTSNFMWLCSFYQLPVAKKPQFLANFDFWGRLDRFVLSPSGGETIFAIFWTSALSDVDSWRQSEKVEHGCTTTNLPLSNGVKIISVLQRLHGKIGRTNSDIHKRDGQKKRDGQIKNSTFFRQPGGGWNPSSTKLGMVIEDLEHVLASPKRLMVWRIVSPLGKLKIWGVTRPRQIKTPITP